MEVSRWRGFISLTVEAYAALEAARGIRPISVERLRGIRIEWDEVEGLGEKFGLKEEVLRLKREVGIG
ncbi:hypothetical protein D9Q81_09440 [Candidatus Korarchaeum cryptofilum]|uniref:Uncharacterized protein n=1 Tax=Candidatus Korarchaeum cryptofilum TaxID=498846 RepID=A0A429FZV0_9CREN|nr:hypothetical protein D9Q81_09440 [Candidatus Korarchaeum cryptofilum]